MAEDFESAQGRAREHVEGCIRHHQVSKGSLRPLPSTQVPHHGIKLVHLTKGGFIVEELRLLATTDRKDLASGAVSPLQVPLPELISALW